MSMMKNRFETLYEGMFNLIQYLILHEHTHQPNYELTPTLGHQTINLVIS